MEGQLLGGRYRVEREVGAGGMGVVYEALDETLGNRVAIKVLATPEDASVEAVARLMREARAAAALGHPNIVRVTDLGRVGEGAFLVMELLQGRDLDRELRSVGTLAIERAVRLHLQLLDALGAAHAAGVLHRDIKPGNIFLTKLADGGELVKLLDFGLAYLMEESASIRLTRTGMALGTPAYMSPERLCGNPLDPRSDLYAVGVSLFESLTGELPFDADHPTTLRGRVLLTEAPNLRDARPEVSDALAGVVSRVLEKRPADRYASAEEMADALRAAVAARSPGTLEPPGATAEANPRARTERGHVAPGVALAGPVSAEERQGLGTLPTLAAISAPMSSPSQPSASGTRFPVTRASSLEAPAAPMTAADPSPTAAPVRGAPPPRPFASKMVVGLLWGAGLGAVLVSGAIVVMQSARQPAETVNRPAVEVSASPAPDASAPVSQGTSPPDPVEPLPPPSAVQVEPEATSLQPVEARPLAPGRRRRGRRQPRPPVTPLTPAPDPTPAAPPPVDPNGPLAPPGW